MRSWVSNLKLIKDVGERGFIERVGGKVLHSPTPQFTEWGRATETREALTHRHTQTHTDTHRHTQTHRKTHRDAFSLSLSVSATPLTQMWRPWLLVVVWLVVESKSG